MASPLLALVVVALASPVPSPSPDPCGGAHTNLLATLNRPTIGFSACSVKTRESVWEIGYANAESSGAHVAAYPQGFLRFGLARGLEFDVIGPAYEAQSAPGLQQNGFLDSGAGLKYEYYQDPSNVAAVDVLYTAPTGSAAFTAGAPIATLNLDYGHSFSSSSGFATTLGVQSSFASDLNGRSSRFFAALPSIVFTTQSNTVTQFYAEAYGQTRLRPDGGALFGLDGGVQYLITDSLEIDGEVGSTVTDLVRAHYVGFGFGLRL
ncbi:MAG TPA: transporter [Candidatus Rubrimentiphilum sp.]|nr:transporter [Candidatus Rubrimentiphilum sp.]